MKQRILVAVVGIPALLAVLCIAPAWATALLLAALSVIAAHELLTAVSGPDKGPPLDGAARPVRRAAAGAAGIFLAGPGVAAAGGGFGPAPVRGADLWKASGPDLYRRLRHGRSGLRHPWAFSGLYGLRMLEGGYLLVLTPLVAAFCSDALALFTGMALGVISWPPGQPPQNRGGRGRRPGGRHGRYGHFLPGVPGHHRCEPGPASCVALGLLGALLGELGT